MEEIKNYVLYLHKIGRRVGFKTEAEKDSMKLTEQEQCTLTGLYIKETQESNIQKNIDKKFLTKMYINQIPIDFIDEIQEFLLLKSDGSYIINTLKNVAIDLYYKEIEFILSHVAEAKKYE